jgi:hypothetical protein
LNLDIERLKLQVRLAIFRVLLGMHFDTSARVLKISFHITFAVDVENENFDLQRVLSNKLQFGNVDDEIKRGVLEIGSTQVVRA